MLARGHRLKVGQVGIVGHVAATRQPRIALDVGKDAVFFNNPDLPETRSEMALPLIAGERVIGVLDVQSTQPAAFSEEDVATLQILADQVALAIENARLLEDSQKAYQEIQTLLGDQTRRNWQERLGNQSLAFTYDLGRVIPRTPQSGPEHPMGAQAPQDKVMVEYPIELRGQQLGKIFLQRPASYGEWTEAERGLLSKVASQVALALENARLVEMIQDRARREELINHIVARTQASLDLETVLRTAVQEVGRAMRVSKIQIRLSEALEEVQP
jgi:GAF domain-containing protein